MALVAETLVEEWLNRRGYFTIRGVKAGRSEIDLLGVSFREAEAVHVEVTVAVDPMGYIGGDNSAKKRSPEEVEAGVEDWFAKKFRGEKSRVENRREELCPDREWRFVLVYGNLKYPEELGTIEERGVEVLHVGAIVEELRDRKRTFVTSSEASGVAELLDICC